MKKVLNGIRTAWITPGKLSAWSFLVLMILSCEQHEISPPDKNAVFMSFSTNGQTLPASIDKLNHQVKLEVGHDVDVTGLIPSFDIPAGYSVYANGVKQASGSSQINFSNPITYELRNENGSTPWQVSVVPLGCKILIDASHDGGVWWFPQHEGTGFNSGQSHQGQSFANLLRQKGFEVTELGRGVELTEEMFFGYYIIIRAGGFQPYTAKEVEVYTNIIERGTNLVFFTDHKKFDPIDELGDFLELKFEGVANGTIDNFTPYAITANMSAINYVAGSVLTNANENPNLQVLGWLREDDFGDLNLNGMKDVNEPTASPVMGILKYPKSRVFFMGDMNGIEIQSQPFIDNLMQWMGNCFVQ
jgi:hypothetical protein